MRHFIINSKNYLEVTGTGLDRLLTATKSARSKFSRRRITFFVAIPAFYLGYATDRFPELRLLVQHVDDVKPGSSTGFLVPEVAKSSGAAGAIINHSEHRLDVTTIRNLVERLRDLKMLSVVCARNPREVSIFSRFSPDFIAIEPPELIGSGIAVSKARPEIILSSKISLDRAMKSGSKTRLLCGAGIVDQLDVRKAVELGSSGILVASGVIKSNNWNRTIDEMAQGLIGEAQR